jgi:HK97 family phage portal protein
MNLLQRIAGVFRTKANPAGEGNWHSGPYRVSGGILPWSSVPWNFWQCDLDPVGYPASSIVEACVWAYIRAIAQLPGSHKREIADGGTETITTSALSRLLRTPNGYQTPSDFLVHLIRSLLYTGNSYWIAQRNERREVVALHWTDPRACRVREVPIVDQSFAEVFYEIGDNPLVAFDPFRAGTIVIPAREVFHVKLATPRHPLIGETWLAALAAELAQRGAITRAQTTYAANTRPSGLLTTDLVLTAAQVDELRARWQTQSAQMAEGGVPILTAGLKFQPVTMSAEDSQTIEQLKLTNAAVAAVFGVPAILLGIGDTATQKSAEAVMAEWLAAGLGWLINHVEVAFDAFIGLNAVPAGREWTEFDTRALLRSLYKERIEGLVRGVQGGIYSPNEARALEGYGAVKAGAEPRVQQQVVPLSFALEPPKPPTPPALPPGEENPDAEDDDEAEDDAELDEDAADEARVLTTYRLRKHMDSINAERRAA